MTCNNDCALCCCCGPGQLVELPDYYCRFHSSLPVVGSNYNCSDATRQYLNWELTEQKANGSSAYLSLLADNFYAYSAFTEFVSNEDVSCFVSYGTFFNPYEQYGYDCFVGGSEQYEETGWKEIERIQYRCIAQGTGGAYVCVRSQTWARISYDIKNPKVNIARCKVPTSACASEIPLQEGLELDDCGYLVTATLDVCYKIETQSYINTGNLNAPCNDLPAFYDTPTGTITTVSQGTVCVTRSRVLKSLKNDPDNTNRIFFDLAETDQAVDCCKDWLSPFLRNTLPLGKPPEWNDENFRCSCVPEASFEITGECPDLTGLTCSNDTICEIDSLIVQYAAGFKWRFFWS